MFSFLAFIAAVIWVVASLWSKMSNGSDEPTVQEAVVSFMKRFALLVVPATLLQIACERYLDLLWFSDLGYRSRFTTELLWRYGSTALFAAVAAAILLPALLYQFWGNSERKVLSVVGTVFAAFFLGLAFSGKWLYLAKAVEAVPFGVVDPIFGLDLSWHIFKLPAARLLLTFAETVCFMALVVCASIASYDISEAKKEARRRDYRKADIRSGHINADDDETSGLFSGGSNTRHLYFLAAAILVMLAAGTVLDMFEMLSRDGGTVFGMGYVDATARVTASYFRAASWIVMAIVVVTVSFTGIPNRGKLLASIMLTLFMSVGVIGLSYILPPIKQSWMARGNELEVERQYLQHNIDATKKAFGIEQVIGKRTTYPAKVTPDEATFKKEGDNLAAVRLWDWEALKITNMQFQSQGTFFYFPDTDVDRYLLDGKLRQLMLSFRELNQDHLPAKAKGWQNRRLVYTHGYGAVANDSAECRMVSGNPQYLLQGIPAVATNKELALTEPRIYFGAETRGHVYVDTGRAEFDYPTGDTIATYRYQGKGGIKIDSLVKKLLIASRIEDTDGAVALMTSKDVTDKSRLLYRRTLTERVKTIAPFLQYDNDPYRVIVDGKIYYIVDAYTVTNRYPYSESHGDINYIRNSVKVVMDAYTGQVDFYRFDAKDPILATFSKIFPGLFKEASQMPARLRAHVRYPEYLMAVQGDVLRRYHMPVDAFYSKSDVWDISSQIADVDNKASVMEPQYLVTHLPGSSKSEFVAQLLFSPHTVDPQHPRGNVVAHLIGRCDGENYGQLVLAEYPKGKTVNGPLQISSRIMQDPVISKDLTMWNQQGSSVIMRRMVTLPFGDGSVMYVQPLFLKSSVAPLPELKRVIIVTDDKIGYGASYQEALAQVMEQSSAAQVVAASGATTSVVSTATTGTQSADAKLGQVAQHLQRYFELTGQGKAQAAGAELEKARAVLGSK